MRNAGQGSDAVPPSSDHVRKRAALARKWTYLLSGLVVVPLTGDELGRELGFQLDALCEGLRAEPYGPAALEVAGERLCGLGYIGEQGLRCTMEVLGKGLLALPEFQPVESSAERIVLGLGAFAVGFLAADRRAVIAQQESMQLSLFKAVRDAKSNLRESEARFDEVATSSTSGIMIIGLDGELVRANAAIGDILGYLPAELTGTTLFDLVHPDSADVLRDAMDKLLAGTETRIRQSQRLLRKNGEIARISLTTSLLRGADEEPSHLVIVVEDGTELMLLQGELKRQVLHDVLTGLPNRQYFSTHLESALRRADPARGVTLFHLDLDAFGMVCNSLGRRVGDRLLVHVAQRLKEVMADERSMVARFDGDEFGILVENTATTPDVATIVSNINADLAEPTFVDGHGLAVSVSVGVVHRPARDLDPTELLRAADLALRRAKTRRGQWEMFHPDQDAHDREAQALAVSMPGAWEQGEVSVVYRRAVRLSDGRTAGVEALLRWDHPELGVLGHDRCAELADQTGLILPVGEWLIRAAVGQAVWWKEYPLVVCLTPYQAADADLVSRVVRVLKETGLRPDLLTIGMPVRALQAAEALDNFRVLADMGVTTMIDEFGGGTADLALLEDLPAKSVRLAPSPFVGELTALVHDTAAVVVVDGVDTADREASWRTAGADLAMGDLYGAPCPPGDISL
ncbi:putative bifunctional diguanylate cyclase/phosphodiesterase [Umezawaea tangerina]|uniref:PAS domain S-box-containing protein/diguanylate cyclase (GGDEF)-like protein n=1 Tax=Umezawaea tangerina TaxID=84725 RepID=A0A2T0SYZ3_9PSEU|nr:diguanylate cyclase [Umezawaea tangerina]PRY38627.1 PAS domain S-box-containing protein/diguanylate cyclase (GGDEF)-like protein [Umezawaea tangerina]